MTPEIVVLYSGSKGNSVFYRCGEDKLLIDAGKNSKQLCCSLERLGVKEVGDIFITHEHTDHISALPVYLKKHLSIVHMTSASLDCANLPRGCVCEHPIRFTSKVGAVSVSSFATPHDSRASVGYVIEGGNSKVGIATDIGYITDEIAAALAGCDSVVLEANHDVGMLINGPYPFHLKQRILSQRGHLSNDDCAKFAVWLAERGTRRFILAHLSEINNLPKCAFDAVRGALDEAGFCDCEVLVASQYEPVGYFEENS